MKVYHLNLGFTDFYEVWQIQEQIHNYKQKNTVNDIILTTEHHNVYTLGKSGDKNHLLIGEDELRKKGIAYYEIDRGGDLTYHGPGQLVCYPILDLKRYYKDAHRYLRDLEETVILTLRHYNIESIHDSEYTGVWVGNEKICAIGIKLSRWITMHGLALNVNNDLSYFGKIIPCGIFHKGVISMKKILNRDIDLAEVERILIDNFRLVFNISIEKINLSDLKEIYALKM
ncbi:MAG: lipoyl(octanoyl) transferase LipB [Ignavibacteria bacterium]|jgi:lipoyl(octanoyl) transferase